MRHSRAASLPDKLLRSLTATHAEMLAVATLTPHEDNYTWAWDSRTGTDRRHSRTYHSFGAGPSYPR